MTTPTVYLLPPNTPQTTQAGRTRNLDQSYEDHPYRPCAVTTSRSSASRTFELWYGDFSGAAPLLESLQHPRKPGHAP